MKTHNTIRALRERRLIDRMIHPFQSISKSDMFAGALLLFMAGLAIVIANSPWAGLYQTIRGMYVTVGMEGLSIRLTLLHWINDGLMAVFFLVVGLEIKRELMVGELASFRRAALPIMAALGGMAVPAVIYAVMNAGGQGARGWGIPMATDIAFSIGVLAMLRNRVPFGAVIFITALAIVDDIGAVVVIAIFYTASLSLPAVIAAVLCTVLLVFVSRIGVRHPLVYAVLGLLLWYALLRSGVHATLAGIITAFTVPSNARINAPAFIEDARTLMREFREGETGDGLVLTSARQQAAVSALERKCEQVSPPMQRIEHTLLPLVRFVILPVFAFMNAGITLAPGTVRSLHDPIAFGIIAGLVFGKPLGITLFAAAAVRMRFAVLPRSVTWRHIIGVSMMAGIGFTMSFFIAMLAFEGTPLLETAKAGILVGSFLSGCAGAVFLRFMVRKRVNTLLAK